MQSNFQSSAHFLVCLIPQQSKGNHIHKSHFKNEFQNLTQILVYHYIRQIKTTKIHTNIRTKVVDKFFWQNINSFQIPIPHYILILANDYGFTVKCVVIQALSGSYLPSTCVRYPVPHSSLL